MGISCCVMLILCQNNKGELQLYFYFTHYRPFPLFLFMCLSLWQSLFLLLGASIGCVNNLKSTADLVLWFPDRTSVCTHPWHQNDFIVFMVPSNLTKLKTLFICQYESCFYSVLTQKFVLTIYQWLLSECRHSLIGQFVCKLSWRQNNLLVLMLQMNMEVSVFDIKQVLSQIYNTSHISSRDHWFCTGNQSQS